MILLKRNEEDIEQVIRSYIYPSLISTGEDGRIWSNSAVNVKYFDIKEDGTARDFIVLDEDPETKESVLLGYCILKNIDYENRNALLSLSMAGNSGASSPATDAVIRFIRETTSYLFNQFDLIKLYGLIDENDPSIKILEALGFTREGFLRQNIYKCGEYQNQFIYSLAMPERK